MHGNGGAMGTWADLMAAWRLRRRRQIRLWRGFRARRRLHPLVDRTAQAAPGVRLFCVLRNEMARLPHFMDHYRALGVAHFLFIDNASTDGSADWLAAQPDVSVWRTTASYRRARFGMDWVQWLMMRHGHGRWCLVVDADELLIYPHHDTRPLPALTAWLDSRAIAAMGALMLDLSPRGPVGAQTFRPGDNPLDLLCWYDRANYTIQRQPGTGALWVQGGPRARVLLADTPRRGPTLTKVPLVKWHWRHAWLNSTHSLLPPRLNRIDGGAGESLTGVLLHTKFLPQIAALSADPDHRAQHFGRPQDFADYYDTLAQGGVDFWHPAATRLRGWRALRAQGLMSSADWG